MSDIRQTEERLRHHLDSNQTMRESMCLALLPILGPFTRERPRRPKGGPDGGRDLEALYNGSLTVWGAVGFRNGGGNDEDARKWAENKYSEDLDRALDENPSLAGFVFFTNVDLTPGGKEALHRKAQARGVQVVEVFDFNIIRHALDSAEGMIARLQYLGIPMSDTEQLALVSKFGSQLQHAVRRIMLDLNGYEVVNEVAGNVGEATPPEWPNSLRDEVLMQPWHRILPPCRRNLLDLPAERSPRYGPLLSL